MGISLGLVGLGSFGRAFAPLFKNHPAVDRIGLCDAEPDRVKQLLHDPFYADKVQESDCYDSLDDICRADFDALVIITQPWLHAPQCLQALESGKHVYSAVPIITLPDNEETYDWCDQLVNAVKRTGRHYMLGETTYYRPETQFCRRQAKAGLFGDFVYAEGEYFHDVDEHCNLRLVQSRRRASKPGQGWEARYQEYVRRGHRDSPMHYPTHSTSGPVAVMQAHALTVTAHGFRNRNHDPYFADAAFSNEIALFRMSNGAVVRICEMRETPGAPGMEHETLRLFGTNGSFSERRWWQANRPDFANIDLENLPRPVVQQLTPKEMFDPLPPEVQHAFKQVAHPQLAADQLGDIEFTPTGHGGSHPYLAHEFVSAVAANRIPAINIWQAVRYMAMGVAANQSALRDGATLNVPDWGDPPEA